MAVVSQTILLIGASRGLGLGLAREYLSRGWRVIATARDNGANLESLAREAGNRLRIERLDITDRSAAAALRARLAGEGLDLLFVVAGISGNVPAPLHAVPPEEAAQVYLTNAYYPVVCAETLADLVKPDGAIAFMTSFMGSITLNDSARWETYRTSKAALNMAARSFFVRHRDRVPTVLSVAPGWVRTDMGGETAPLDVTTSVRGVADAVAARCATPGHHHLNYDGKDLPW